MRNKYAIKKTMKTTNSSEIYHICHSGSYLMLSGKTQLQNTKGL